MRVDSELVASGRGHSDRRSSQYIRRRFRQSGDRRRAPRVTIVGPSCGQAEAFATKIRAATATGPNDPIVDNVVIDMAYNCVS